MKKLFFLFAMLANVAASATVTVTPLGVDYAAQKVTFKVAWTGSAYNNRVWVWIDLCPAPNVTPGAFQDAVISAASATSGSVIYASTNTRGFFVTTNPSTVTATLGNATGKFNWCAYGSDAPPNVAAANGTYTFKGTPPFIVTAANGTTSQTVTGKTLPASALTVTSVALTDRTGYPSVFCIYTGSDLLIDATHFCQQRTSGAKNWEAYIKDSRDNNIYRIIQMPDNKWYMAQNLNYRGVTYYCYGNNSANCNVTNGVWYRAAQVSGTICPSGWHVFTTDEWNNFINIGGSLPANFCPVSESGNDMWGFNSLCIGYGCQYTGEAFLWQPILASCNGYHLASGTCTVGYARLGTYPGATCGNHSEDALCRATRTLSVRCMRN